MHLVVPFCCILVSRSRLHIDSSLFWVIFFLSHVLTLSVIDNYHPQKYTVHHVLEAFRYLRRVLFYFMNAVFGDPVYIG